MQKPINTGLLSYGMSGKLFHAPFLAAHTGFNLSAVAERSEKKAQLQFPDIKSYPTIEALLADPDLELVIVNTPNYTHFDFAQHALRAGKNVLLEKPFAVTVAEATGLFELADTLNLQILPYQNRRYDSDYLSAKEIIESGKLGRLVEVHIRYDRYRYHIGPKVAKETSMPGSGLLYDLGPHLLDMVINLLGKPLEWRKTLGHFRPDTQVDDYATIHLQYPGEVQVFVTMSMLVADEQPAFMIHGTKGSYIKQRSDIQEKQLLQGMSPDDPRYGIEEEGRSGKLTIVEADGTKTTQLVSVATTNYLNLFEAVHQTIREGEPFPVTREQIIQQIEILES